MKEIGELLQKARQEKGLTLERVSSETKISIRQLKALEEGDFSVFAGEVYLKGALRSFAEAVGLDASQVISSYKDLLQQQAATENQVEKEHQKPAEKKFAEKKKKKPLYSGKESRSFPSVPLIWLGVLVIIVGGSIWYSHQNNNAAESPYDDNYAAKEVNENDDPGEEEEPVEPEPEPEPEPELVEESREETTAVYRIENVAEKEIQINYTDRCWTRVYQDGERVDEGTYDEGETVRLGDAEKTEIELGFAVGAIIEVNGQEVPELTRTGRMAIIINKGD